MTYARIAELARGFARVGTSSHTDAEVYERINEALIEFAVDVFGLPMRTYIDIAASFDLRTSMAFHLDMTDATLGDVDADVVVTATDVDSQTGTQTATRLQTQIQAAGTAASGVTVSWTEFAFTLTIPATTTVIAITSPDSDSYSDAVEEMFGGSLDTNDLSGTSLGGGFPQQCTIIQSLPTDIADLKAVYWEKTKLLEVNWEDIIRGTSYGNHPSQFAVRGDSLALYPAPNEQGECYVLYKGTPASVTAASEDGTSNIDEIPTRFQYGIAYLVASKLCGDLFDEEGLARNYILYKGWRAKYLAWYLASQPADERPVNALWYRVET